VYNYKGFLLTPQFSWNLAHDKLSSQANKAIYAVSSLDTSNEGFKIFDFMVNPVLLMNSFNKTEAAVFSCRLCFLRAFPFITLILLTTAGV